MVELRRLEHPDVPEVTAIQQAIIKKKVSPTWTRMVERNIDNEDGVGFVAVRDGRVAGFVIGEVKREGFGVRQSGWIEVVAVAPQAMGEGVGKAMLDRLLEHFRKKRIKSVHTAVRWDSGDMLSFFKSVGFGRSDFINLIRST